jgi:filamentous hemagglutinin family protein
MTRTSVRSRHALKLHASTALAVSLAGFAAVSSSFVGRAEGAVLPQGGTVVVGAATIASSLPNRLDVTTATDRTAINWQSFSIGAGDTVSINQPHAGSLTLNQVTGADPSAIFGSLRSNGQVVLANPNGIWFGAGSHVDVASIVATTATASQAALNAFAHGGALMLDQAGRADASVINAGTISIGDEGLAGLVAPGVANSGIIAARLGRVVLASGTVATLDFYGDGLISFAVGGQVTAQAKDQAGRALGAAVVNSGTITNVGGTVLMTAAAAKTVVDNTINMSGVVVASAVNARGGEIDLDGGSGTTSVSGQLLASSQTVPRQHL